MSKVKRTHFDIMTYVDIEDPGFPLSYTSFKEGNLKHVSCISATELLSLSMNNCQPQETKIQEKGAILVET